MLFDVINCSLSRLIGFVVSSVRTGDHIRNWIWECLYLKTIVALCNDFKENRLKTEGEIEKLNAFDKFCQISLCLLLLLMLLRVRRSFRSVAIFSCWYSFAHFNSLNCRQQRVRSVYQFQQSSKSKFAWNQLLKRLNQSSGKEFWKLINSALLGSWVSYLYTHGANSSLPLSGTNSWKIIKKPLS